MNNQIKRPYFLTFRGYAPYDYPLSRHCEEQREGDSVEELKEYALKLWAVFNNQWPNTDKRTTRWGCLIQENFLPGGDKRNYVVCYTKPEDYMDGLVWHTEGYHVWINTEQKDDWKD